MNTKLSSKELFWLLLIIGLGILIYGYSLTNGFVWDDDFYIWKNPAMTSLSGLVKMWTSSEENIFYDYPLTLSAFWLEHKLWGFNPWSYHTINLMLHLLNALLLFGLIRKLAPAVAGVTALLFTIHPIQVETVAWISEQKNLLCLFFFLWAFHSFLDFDKYGRKRDYFKMLFFFILALLSKSVAASFAVIPLFYAWYQHGSIPKRSFLLALPLFLLGGLSILIPICVQNFACETLNMPVFPKNIILAGKLFFFYIKQVLFPLQFLTFYPKWDVSISHVVNWIYPLGVVSLYIILYGSRRRFGRGAFTLLSFYGISIFPVLGFQKLTFLENSYAADRWSYLAVPTVLLLCCAAIHFLFLKAKNALAKRGYNPSPFFIKSVIIVGVFYLSLLSFRLSLNYKNSMALFTYLLMQCPDSSIAHYFVGNICLLNPTLCEPDLAVTLFKKAIQLRPKDALAYSALGAAYKEKKMYTEALEAYQQAVLLGKESFFPFLRFDCYQRMGDICLLQKKPLEEAASYYEQAIHLRKIHPGFQKPRFTFLDGIKTLRPAGEEVVYQNLGIIYLQSGRNEAAAEAFRNVVRLAPAKAEGYHGLGTAYMNLGEIRKALPAFQEASRLDPEDEDVRKDLKVAQIILKQTTKN
ncbi:MAG: tetratricopeptide repeat protein [Candidatus Omnitrophota bacterium]